MAEIVLCMHLNKIHKSMHVCACSLYSLLVGLVLKRQVQVEKPPQ